MPVTTPRNQRCPDYRRNGIALRFPRRKLFRLRLRCKNRCLRLPNTALFLGLPQLTRIGLCHTLRSILKASNRRPTGLQWTEFVKRKWSAWWRTKCNGIAIELGYWSNSPEATQQLRESARVQPLAGVEMLTLQSAQLESLMVEAPFLAQNYPDITALAADPIPLIWAHLQK